MPVVTNEQNERVVSFLKILSVASNWGRLQIWKTQPTMTQLHFCKLLCVCPCVFYRKILPSLKLHCSIFCLLFHFFFLLKLSHWTLFARNHLCKAPMLILLHSALLSSSISFSFLIFQFICCLWCTNYIVFEI